MTIRKLRRQRVCYRIGDPDGEYPIFDARGSVRAPGRWNDADSPVIYAADTYSGAMLEKLAHGNGELPANQHFIEIALPAGISYEVVTKDSLPGWESADCTVPKQFGSEWVHQKRSLALFVPSYVARMEENVLINPAHPELPMLEPSKETPVWWDERLFPAITPRED